MEQLRHFLSEPSAETMPARHRRLGWVVAELEEFNYEEVRGSGRKNVPAGLIELQVRAYM